MQIFEAQHWWRTYAIVMDEEARTLEIRYPKETIKWDLDRIGAVDIKSRCVGPSRRSNTESMAEGYMLGGVVGAFLAPFYADADPTVVELWFYIWRATENEKSFGYPPISIRQDEKIVYKFPGNNKMYDTVVSPAVYAINAELKKKNKPAEFKRSMPSWWEIRQTVNSDEECIKVFNELDKKLRLEAKKNQQ